MDRCDCKHHYTPRSWDPSQTAEPVAWGY